MDAEFGALLAAEERWLRGHVRRIVRDDVDTADDITQETLLAAWRFRSTFKNDGGMRAWLSVIARNKYRSCIRNRIRTPEVNDPDQALANEIPQPDTAAELIDQHCIIERMLTLMRGLTKRHRTALIGFHLDHLTYTELAEKLDCPLGTVRSTLFRARDELRRRLGNELCESV